MSLATIRTAFRAALLALSYVGKVHEYVRIGNEASFGPEHFEDAGKVNALFFSVIPAKARLAFSEKESTYRFAAKWFLSANDADGTLKDAADNANALADAIFTNAHMTTTCDWSDPIEIDSIDTRLVAIGEANVLCHIVTFRWTAYQRATVTYT